MHTRHRLPEHICKRSVHFKSCRTHTNPILTIKCKKHMLPPLPPHQTANGTYKQLKFGIAPKWTCGASARCVKIIILRFFLTIFIYVLASFFRLRQSPMTSECVIISLVGFFNFWLVRNFRANFSFYGFVPSRKYEIFFLMFGTFDGQVKSVEIYAWCLC